MDRTPFGSFNYGSHCFFDIFYSMKYPKMMPVMLPRHDQNLSLNPSYQNTISHYNVATHGYPKSIK
jgi:hypothetical protein